MPQPDNRRHICDPLRSIPRSAEELFEGAVRGPTPGFMDSVCSDTARVQGTGRGCSWTRTSSFLYFKSRQRKALTVWVLTKLQEPLSGSGFLLEYLQGCTSPFLLRQPVPGSDMPIAWNVLLTWPESHLSEMSPHQSCGLCVPFPGWLWTQVDTAT